MEKAGQVTADQATLLMADARPRSLYVWRDVVNVAQIRAWAKEQGLPELNNDLHVTIAYSRTPIDWIKAGNASDWGSGQKRDQLIIPEGGPRAVEPLGDQSAVLLFASSQLAWRHRQILEAGASHDFSDYVIHISLTAADVDLDGIEPYRGPIVLGPEIFEEVKPRQGKPAGTGPFDDTHWESQPRDPGGEGGGQWVRGGGEGVPTGQGNAKPWDENKPQVIAANAGKPLDQMMDEAHANQLALRTLGNQLEAETGIDFREPPAGFEVKTRASVERKMRDEAKAAHQITDISRATFVVRSFGEADQVVARLSETTTVYDKGWKHLDRNGYADRKLYIAHANGGLSEVQLVPQGVQDYKDGQGHRLYELERDPSQPRAARDAAARKMRTVYHRLMRGAGFGKLIKAGK